jgi:hypothetical protein
MYLIFSFSTYRIPKIINIEFAVLCSFVQPDPFMLCNSEKFEDTKRVIRRHKSFIHLEVYIQVYMTTVNSLDIFVCTNFSHLEVYIQVYMTTVNSLDILVCWVCVAQSLVFFVVSIVS